MVRKLTFALVLGTSLLAARDASAIPITPTNLDTWVSGPSVRPSMLDDFIPVDSIPPTMGSNLSDVYFDGTQYTYVLTVTPGLDNNLFFNTAFEIPGFTGVAGWSFADADAVGGSGASSFFINDTGQVSWLPLFGPGAGWDEGEAISFFFVSTKPPGVGPYNLLTGSEFGTAQGYAPVPEPGSIALLGSGLVGLYTAMRRRRNLTA